MARIRETQIERDENGRVIEERVEIKRRGAGFAPFLFVLILGLIALGGYFVVQQGSLQEAGREADRAAAQVEQQVQRTAEAAGNQVEQFGDQVERATN